ncbi:MAG: transglycosylase domain-containing protein [Bacillota bacterium]
MKRKITMVLVVFIFCSVVAYGAVLTKDMRQKLENISMASVVYDRHNQLIGNLYYYNRIWVPLTKIPKSLQNAVIAIEDSRFYQHNGVDLRGIARAFIRDIIPGGGVEGGSTITQQLAKIALLSQERTITRKIEDISYALEIEKVYTKKEILELYLNSVYLAHGNAGVEAAARYYFGKSASQLNLEESALIAGLIQSPENYSPLKHPKESKERRNVVLKRMLDLKYISAAQYKKAAASGLHVVSRQETASVGAYFLDYVRQYLISNEKFTEEQLRYGGYKIYTTLDLTAQRDAEHAMAVVPKVTAKVQPQAALITLDPRTGEILAMVGGRDYRKSQYNRVTKSYRQPGSAIKPFVYATALEKGFTAASIFEDKPLAIPMPDGSEWKPENYDRNYRGRMTLREALKQSINTVAVQLLQQVGVDNVAAQMEKMGINSLVKSGKFNDVNLAPLALGGLTKGVTPMELAASYTPFANGGVYSKPVAVRKITDRHGNLLKEFSLENRNEPVLSPQAAYIMTSMLEDVINGSDGTGWRAKLPDRPAAGKTGTTSDYTNAWFIGYTPDLLTAVWIGNDRQDHPMIYKEGNIGSASAAEVWGAYMRQVTAGRPVLDFPEPPGIIWADVNPDSGQAVPGWLGGSTYKEVFKAETVPQSAAYRIWRWFFPGKKDDSQPAEADPANQEGNTQDSAGGDGSQPGQAATPQPQN